MRPIISADSHVIEPMDTWDQILPSNYWANEDAIFSEHPGGHDPVARIDAMDTDGVSAEVLYPSVAMKLFGLEDPDLQARAFRRYNEWLVEYCSHDLERLLGVGLIPVYDMDVALAEIEWCKRSGLRGVQIWQVPPTHLPFKSSHYEPFWEACAENRLSISLHIITGFGYATEAFANGKKGQTMGDVTYKITITKKLAAVQDALIEIMASGALDRYRDLRFVLVENECSWIPFFLEQMDYYFRRFNPGGSERLPSELFAEHVLATFFRDLNTAFCAQQIGAQSLMWSSDFPHGNSSWPNSQQMLAERIGGLPDDMIQQMVWDNVSRLFNISELSSH